MSTTSKQPDFVGVLVSQNRTVYLDGGTATVYQGGSRILVSGGTSTNTASPGEVYKITNGEGLLDTHGLYLGNGEFINVQ